MRTKGAGRVSERTADRHAASVPFPGCASSTPRRVPLQTLRNREEGTQKEGPFLDIPGRVQAGASESRPRRAHCQARVDVCLFSFFGGSTHKAVVAGTRW